VLNDLLAPLYHMIATLGEVLEGNIFFDPITRTVKGALAKALRET
jgi:hypothetical protein